MITKNDINRYRRHFSIKDWDQHTQEKLKSSKIFIAGAGGLGSPLLLYLAGAGAGHLTVCDYDSVDLTNLNRQILYNDSDIGKNKASAAADALKRLNGDIEVKFINDAVSLSMESEIESCDLIVDCLDNFKTRHILNEISVKSGIPLIHGGVSEYYGQVTFIKPGETACLSCFSPDSSDKSSSGILGAVAGTIGSIQALEAVKYITQTGELLKDRLLFFDGLKMEFTTLKISRNPKCSICSHLYGGQ